MAAPTDNAEDMQFAEYLEGEQVRPLLEALRKSISSEQAIALHAGEVKRVSTLALQVLAAASASAQRHQLKFEIATPSPEFERACADTGLQTLLSRGA